MAGTAGALFAAGMAAGRPDDPEYYRSLRQAPFAPPAWAFGPAWGIAKTGWAWTVTRVARNREMPNRSAFLVLAAADAAIYVSFSYVYFRRRSTTLAAVWTAADAAVTAGEVGLLVKADPKGAAGLGPQAAWLALATPVAIYQAKAN